MPHPDSRLERLRTAARWPFGIVLTSYRYLWRLTPIERWEWPASLPHDAPPALPSGIDRTDLQTPEDGVGPLVRRLYRVRIRGSSQSPEKLVRTLTSDLDAVAPSEFASFQKRSGDDGTMHVNDDYVVRMPGPWDGPVRVVACSPTSFRLATLRGHLEAGQIEFRACTGDGSLEFTIESWARSGDRLSDLMYTYLRVSKEVQLHMWTSVLERVIECSGGHRHGPLAILTRRVDLDTGETANEPILHGPRNPRARQRLAALAGRSLNFDIDGDHTVAQGWHVDEVARDLPVEPSGPPVPGGSWETARRLMISYEVADPDVVRATYRQDVPPRGRDMLLEIRLAALIRFRVGVRIGGDYDDTRIIDGREVRVFGWDYATLEGHFQSGRVRYEVWKWLDNGVVEFRLRAFTHGAQRAAAAAAGLPPARPVAPAQLLPSGGTPRRRPDEHATRACARRLVRSGRRGPNATPALFRGRREGFARSLLSLLAHRPTPGATPQRTGAGGCCRSGEGRRRRRR
jgi:uncharacterized protein (UPF0548 family)